MTKLDSSTPKSKSVAGWIFGGLSFIPLLGILFGIITIIIGVVKKVRGQVFLGIAGILFTIILYSSLSYFGFVKKTGIYADMKVKLTSQLINTTAGQIALYKKQHNELPTKISDLGTPSQSNMFFTVDPWMTEILYTLKNNEAFELKSAGPDKKFETEDDIYQTF